MTRFTDAVRGHGHRARWARAWARCSPARAMQVALYDTSAEALERAKAGYELAWGVLDRLETPVVEGGVGALRERRRRRPRGRRVRDRGHPREPRAQAEGRTRSTSSTSARR